MLAAVGSPPTQSGSQPSNSRLVDRRADCTHSRDALCLSLRPICIWHTSGSPGTISQNISQATLLRLSPLTARTALGQDLSHPPPIATDLITEPSHSKWPPPAPKWAQEVAGLYSTGIRERNQGAFLNNMISLSRNCDHGGAFSQTASIPVCVPSWVSTILSLFAMPPLPSFTLKGRFRCPASL